MTHRLIRRDLLRASLACGVALLLSAARACAFFFADPAHHPPWTRASEPGATTVGGEHAV